ncbi:hypothetical protein PGB90_002861 [Kerria lacca]
MDGFRAPAELENPADWPKWKQAFEFLLEAIERSTRGEKVKIGALLTCLSKKYLDIYNYFVWSEDDIKTKIDATYTGVLNKFDAYFEPQKNTVFERHKFFTRRQKVGETLDDFLTSLKTLAALCDFAPEEKDKLIRDILILGLQDQSSIEHLLKEPKLTLNKAATFLRAKELSEKQTKVIIANLASIDAKAEKSASSSVDAIRAKRICYKCNTSHPPRSCPAFGKKCNFCKVLNHFESACRLHKTKSKKNKYKSRGKTTHAINTSGSDSDLSSDSDTLNLDSIQVASIQKDKNKFKIKKQAWYVNVNVNGVFVRFKLDTGSTPTIIPKTIFEKMNIAEKRLKKSSKILEPYMSPGLKLLGKIKLECTYKNRSIKEKIYVVDRIKSNDNADSTCLLGLNACVNLGLIKRIDALSFKNKDDIFDKYSDVFERKKDKLPVVYKMKLKKDILPIVEPVRCIPFALKR